MLFVNMFLRPYGSKRLLASPSDCVFKNQLFCLYLLICYYVFKSYCVFKAKILNILFVDRNGNVVPLHRQ